MYDIDRQDVTELSKLFTRYEAYNTNRVRVAERKKRSVGVLSEQDERIMVNDVVYFLVGLLVVGPLITFMIIQLFG